MHNYASVKTGAKIRIRECPRGDCGHQGEDPADPGQGQSPLWPVCQPVQVSYLVTSSSLCSPPDASSDTLIAGEAPLHTTVNISLMPRNASGGAELVSVTGF